MDELERPVEKQDTGDNNIEGGSEKISLRPEVVSEIEKEVANLLASVTDKLVDKRGIDTSVGLLKEAINQCESQADINNLTEQRSAFDNDAGNLEDSLLEDKRRCEKVLGMDGLVGTTARDAKAIIEVCSKLLKNIEEHRVGVDGDLQEASNKIVGS